MPTAVLEDRVPVDVTGPEAEHFLQNLITTDLSGLGDGEALPGALLSPQGKIMFDFLVSRIDGGLRLDLRRDLADDLVKRLTLYKLRAKVTIAKQDQMVVAASWQDDSTPSQTDSGGGIVDRRFVGFEVRRIYGNAVRPDDGARDAWARLRIRHAVAESGSDFEAGDAFPHDVLLDQNGGVGFRKGCYVGQEVVSRMQHRGTARRRVLQATATDGALPAPGAVVTAGGRPIGQLGTTAGAEGLALVRIDKAKDAMDAGVPILAGDAPVTLTLPAWVRFDFPEASGAEEA